jgi:hypothetical protein
MRVESFRQQNSDVIMAHANHWRMPASWLRQASDISDPLLPLSVIRRYIYLDETIAEIGMLA